MPTPPLHVAVSFSHLRRPGSVDASSRPTHRWLYFHARAPHRPRAAGAPGRRGRAREVEQHASISHPPGDGHPRREPGGAEKNPEWPPSRVDGSRRTCRQSPSRADLVAEIIEQYRGCSPRGTLFEPVSRTREAHDREPVQVRDRRLACIHVINAGAGRNSSGSGVPTSFESTSTMSDFSGPRIAKSASCSALGTLN